MEKILNTNKNISRMIDVLMLIIIAAAACMGGLLSLGKGLDFDTYVYAGLTNGDALSVSALAKSIQESGVKGMYFNPRLGAPGIQSMIDYPGADLVMGVTIWIISLFTASIPRIVYVYCLFTFAADALILAILLRKMRIRRDVTGVISLIFAFAPYHLLRGLGHLTLMNYMSFAIAAYLSLCILGYFEKEKSWKIIVASIVLGFGYGYYYAFGLIMMGMAVIVRFCRECDLKKTISYIWIPLVTLLAIMLALSPQIIFSAINGKNPIAGVRSPLDQEFYGLKIMQMFLPPSYSRIYKLFPMLGFVFISYVDNAPLVNENITSSLGIVTLIGFIGLCVAFIYSFTVKNKCRTKEWMLIDYLSLTTLAFILMGAIGGFGEIFNFAVTAQIRCYNRSSIYIAGLSLLFLAVMINKLHFKHNATITIICIVIFSLALFDSLPINNADWQADVKKTQNSYEKYFTEIEKSLDEGAMIYQLPYLDYPEAGSPYDGKPFIGYLFTDSLKWSYGGIKGRDTEARDLYVDEGKSLQFIGIIKKAGFEAVYVDRAGYEDNGEEILAFYNTLGIEPIVSSDDMLYVYDIRDLK